MKNAIIFHGMGATPNSFWIPWLKAELEKKEYAVNVPQLPQADAPDLKVQLPFALENCTFDSETVLIGHSAGCPLILSLLEGINVTVKKVIFIAGFCTPLGNDTFDPIIQEFYNWKKIHARANEFIFINSDNDPWGCDVKQGKLMRKQLGGRLIVAKGEGHFGSETYNQQYKEFPLLLKAIEEN